MCHNFSIRSSADGHLGCSRVLAVVNGAAMNTGVHVSFSIAVFSGYVPSSGIAESYMHAKSPQSCLTLCCPTNCSPPGSSVHGILQAGILKWVAMPSSKGSSRPRDWTQVSHIEGGLFTNWDTRELFSIVVLSVYIPTNCGSLFSTPWPAFIVCRFFDDGHSDQCEVIPHCSFDLHLSNSERCWAFFHVFVGHLYVFFGEMSVQVFFSFWLGCFSFCVYVFINSNCGNLSTLGNQYDWWI